MSNVQFVCLDLRGKLFNEFNIEVIIRFCQSLKFSIIKISFNWVTVDYFSFGDEKLVGQFNI